MIGRHKGELDRSQLLLPRLKVSDLDLPDMTDKLGSRIGIAPSPKYR